MRPTIFSNARQQYTCFIVLRELCSANSSRTPSSGVNDKPSRQMDLNLVCLHIIRSRSMIKFFRLIRSNVCKRINCSQTLICFFCFSLCTSLPRGQWQIRLRPWKRGPLAVEYHFPVFAIVVRASVDPPSMIVLSFSLFRYLYSFSIDVLSVVLRAMQIITWEAVQVTLRPGDPFLPSCNIGREEH